MFEISQLKEKKLADLQEIAKTIKVPKYRTLKKLDLVYKILDVQAETETVVVLKTEEKKAITPTEKPKRARVTREKNKKKELNAVAPKVENKTTTERSNPVAKTASVKKTPARSLPTDQKASAKKNKPFKRKNTISTKTIILKKVLVKTEIKMTVTATNLLILNLTPLLKVKVF